MKITAIKYGETFLSHAAVFRGGNKNQMLKISLLFYLIELPNRRILVDVGCDTMPGFELQHFCGPIAALQAYGLTAEQITDVVITHAHGDHIEALHYFKNATVYIQQDEYVKGKNRVPSDMCVHLFDDSVELTPYICAQRIAGHSIGSSVVLVQAKEQVFVLCGDECYSKECFEKNIPTGSSVNPQNSESFVQKYREKPYVPCVFHDADILPGENGYQVIYEET